MPHPSGREAIYPEYAHLSAAPIFGAIDYWSLLEYKTVMRKVTMSVTLSAGLRDRVVTAATLDGRSTSGWVSRALAQVLDEIDARATQSAQDALRDVAGVAATAHKPLQTGL